jgi:tryptophan synthase alpha chain
LPDFLARVRTATRVPRVVGFGVSTPEHVAALRGMAEGAIVASALIDAIDESEPSEAVARAADYVRRLAGAARCDSSAT